MIAEKETPISGKNMRKQRGRSVTINHVAKLAGISRATVSRAFTEKDRVAEKTREKIFNAARILNYQPNVLAQGLVGGRTRTIAVIWPLSSAPVDLALTTRLSSRLQQQEYMPYICDLPSTYSDIKRLITGFAQRGVDGLIISDDGKNIITETMRDDLYDHFRAVVLETGTFRNIDCCDEVIRDRTGAIRKVVAHFAESGRKCPLLITSGDSDLSQQNKINAFTDECHRQSLKLLPNACVISPYLSWKPVPPDVIKFLDDLAVNGTFPFDAVICDADIVAITVRSWLRKRKLKVPDNVALIGFNNSDITPFTDPPLASVDRCIDETIDAICKMLFARLEEPDIPAQHQEIPMKFIWRESAGGMPPEGLYV